MKMQKGERQIGIESLKDNVDENGPLNLKLVNCTRCDEEGDFRLMKCMAVVLVLVSMLLLKKVSFFCFLHVHKRTTVSKKQVDRDSYRLRHPQNIASKYFQKICLNFFFYIA